ncbi:MAG: PspC domain-containing protein [Chitinophagaceae bacterium]|nr:PspC domain-containing protein [Chitinophagaceae bacterium]MCB9047485.1 PspC domain-containing protein [Chitinophagales bacterium]
MQRIIQITIGGRVIPIEELAYARLNDYITLLERQFSGEPGRDEIILDIESRIAELFAIRLENGAQSIDTSDVQKVIATLGNPSDFNENSGAGSQQANYQYTSQYEPSTRRLYRNPKDKMLGGVCSGIANYFDIDTVLVRLVFAILFLTMGVGLLAYILAWIIIPVARTPQEMYYMKGAPPMDFQTMKKNMGDELQDLKKKGEEMSQELKDFFRNKK